MDKEWNKQKECTCENGSDNQRFLSILFENKKALQIKFKEIPISKMQQTFTKEISLILQMSLIVMASFYICSDVSCHVWNSETFGQQDNSRHLLPSAFLCFVIIRYTYTCIYHHSLLKKEAQTKEKIAIPILSLGSYHS